MSARWKVLLPVMLIVSMIGIGLLRAYLQPAVKDRIQPSVNACPPVAEKLPIAGSASCSARGCHGNDASGERPDHCGQNEFTLWSRDRHADAYRTLFSERSATIVKLLGGNAKASDDPRCLTCHVTPQLAAMPADSPFVQREKQFGVGCESCHGSANDWLVAHTAPDWRQKKSAYAMPDLADPRNHVKACVGCHVGGHGDVTHDLIAAGHPRLTFEFASYHANMPPHWRSHPQSDAQLWAIGQLASAEAALALTSKRADAGPWPEFAEYDCFACHHALTSPSWRQSAKRAGKPGELPWGTWYFVFTRDLAEPSASLDSLADAMRSSRVNRADASKKAQDIMCELQTKRVGRADAARVLARFKDGKLRIDPNWDSAEQLYLAMQALQPSADLNQLAAERAFAPGYAGPLSLPTKGQPAFRPDHFIDKLKMLAK
jgi:hypothetical protein